jgi:hypothetical protein
VAAQPSHFDDLLRRQTRIIEFRRRCSGMHVKSEQLSREARGSQFAPRASPPESRASGRPAGVSGVVEMTFTK